MKKKFLVVAMVLAMVIALAACGDSKSGGDSGKVKDKVTVGQTWVINDDNPLDGGNPWSITAHGIGEYVYTIQPDGTLESRYVKELKQVDDLNWEGVMKEDAKFSDGTDVKAEDLCKCLNTIIEKNEMSTASAGKIEYTPTGEYTFTAKTERPTKVLPSILAEWTNVVFKEADGKYVFTGPFVIKNLKPGAELVLEPNKNYPDSEKRPKEVVIKAFKDVNALKLAMQSDELDLAFGLTGEVAKQLKDDGKNVIDFPAGYQYYTFLNMGNEALAKDEVREALDEGINRKEIIKALNGGKEPTGLFAGYNSFNAKEKVEFDSEDAAKHLDEAGYTLKSGDKYRKNANGEELKLDITTYSSKADLPIIAQVLVSEFEKLGIKSEVKVVDNIDEVADSGNYDVLLYAQHPSPTGDAGYFLNQFFRTGGPKNRMKYSSAEVDSLLDKLGTVSDKGERDKLAVEIQEKVIDDHPVIMTVDPEWHAAVSDRLKDYKLWNGDYFIVNPTLMVK